MSSSTMYQSLFLIRERVVFITRKPFVSKNLKRIVDREIFFLYDEIFWKSLFVSLFLDLHT